MAGRLGTEKSGDELWAVRCTQEENPVVAGRSPTGSSTGDDLRLRARQTLTYLIITNG